VEVFYFTYTGTSKKIAETLAGELGVEVKEISAPCLPYFVWLLFSFFPGLPIKANFSLPRASSFVLCFPKWTFNCPPVTYFFRILKRCGLRFEKIVLVISYRGWKEKPFVRLYQKLARGIARKVEVFIILQKDWETQVKNLLVEGRL